MRQVHRITITDISIEKRAKAIDIISAALVAQYHRNVMVIQEGHSSESAIDLLPPNVSVFVISGEKIIIEDPVVEVAAPYEPMRENLMETSDFEELAARVVEESKRERPYPLVREGETENV